MTDEQNPKPLNEMTRAELFVIADERKIVGRHDMNKAQLLEAVEEALTAPNAGEATGGAEATGADSPPDGETQEITAKDVGSLDAVLGTQSDPAPEADKEKQAPDDGSAKVALEAALIADAKKREDEAREKDLADAEARRLVTEGARLDREREAEEKDAARRASHAAGILTPEDHQIILRAGLEELEGVLLTAPDFVCVAVRAELGRRERVAKVQRQRAELVTDPSPQYRITGGPVGMRYVTPTAYSTTLPLGSIVSPLAHNLDHVKAQGFTFEPSAGIALSTDQMGNQVSVAK